VALLVLVAICPFASFFKIKNGNGINLLTKTCLSFGLPKIIYFQSFLVISFVFSNILKKKFKLKYRKRSLRRRRIINWRRKWQTSFWKPRLQRQNICKSLLFSLSILFFSQVLSFFSRLSLQFFHKTFFCTHFENKKNSNLLIEDKNEKAFYFLLPFEM
jgi:hypothetical protein